MGSSALSLTLLLMSFIHSGLTQDSPRSTLTVTPDSSVFTGERVILTCVIEPDHRDWRYEWYKDSVILQSSQRHTVERNTLTIEGSESSDEGQYTCRGKRDERPNSSQSSSVSLSVKERPKPVVKVSPDQRVFRGETVTLTCVIQRGGHIQWTYSWFKDGNAFYPYTTTTAEYRFRADVSDSGEYSCRGERSDSQTSHISAALTLTVSDLPRSTLTVTPDSPIFTGERVILTCVITPYHNNWRYEWYKDRVKLQSSDRYTVDRNTLTIEGSESSDEGQYTCRGQRDTRSVSSQSSSVSLSVKVSPRSTLTVTPDNTVFTGERVILTCVIESDHRDWRQRNGLRYDRRYYWTPVWRYVWYKDSVKLQSSDRYTVNTDTLTIRAVTTSDEGQYTCRGQRDTRPNSSQSSSVSLSVTERPEAVVKVSPDQRVFRGETVTLTCVIQRGGDIQWTYSWFKDGDTRYPYTTTTTAELSFTASVSYSGEYSCRGERRGSRTSHISAALTLTVSDSPRSTLTVTPDSPVFTGETVNLKCVIESNHTDWRYEWYKGRNNSVKLQSSDCYTVNRDTLTIRGASQSDQDQFWCRGQRDKRSVSSKESEPINLSVNASSSRLVTGVVVGSSVCLLFFLSLLLMWRYKKNKDQQRNINQTSVPNQSAQSHLENSPLQSDQSQ